MPHQKHQFEQADPIGPDRKPGKFDTDGYRPVIWSTRSEDWYIIRNTTPPLIDTEQSWGAPNGGWFEILVCSKLMVRTRDLKEKVSIPTQLPGRSAKPDQYITCKNLLHPVAIVLTHPVHVLYGVPGSLENEHRKWIVNDVKKRGMDKRAAQAALAAAYKGFGEGGIWWPEINRALFKFSAPYRTNRFYDSRPMDRTMLRDVALWINWDHWKRHNIPLKRRAEILEEWGYECTLKTLRKVIEHIGA